MTNKTKFLLGAALNTVLATVLSSQAFAQTQTNRQLDLIADPVAVQNVPSAGGDVAILPVVGIFWDERCASVEYTFNSSLAANPGTEAEISPADLAAIVQTGLDRWNDNPSSYIDMNVTNVTELGLRPRVGGDFVNEVTFITPDDFTALASSPSTSLNADTTFLPGDDLDEDGDSDVFDPAQEGINVCRDIDGDGDIEFPAGDYLAGTILDNDVQFATDVVWETTPTVGGGADVDAVSTHEFGHSHGLSHSTINQISEDDGTSATMFPFIATNDPNAELGSRTPHVDDLAASAYIYQEGNGTTEISELQSGDVAFETAFTLVSGNVLEGDGSLVPGAAIALRNRNSGRVESMAYSGEVVVFGDLETGGLFVTEDAFVDADYAVPVPFGNVYLAEIEALDDNPVATGNISLTAIVAGLGGANVNFPEEGWTRRDSAIELRPGFATPFWAGRGGRDGTDFVVNQEEVQANALTRDFAGTGAIIGASSIRYAEMFDREEVETRIANGDILIGGGAETFLIGEAADTFSFSQASIAIGTVGEDGNVDITSILASVRDVLAQDGDLTQFNYNSGPGIPFRIRREFNRNPDAQLFLLADIDNVETGEFSGLPLGFVSVDTTQSGTSFLSLDNGPLEPFGSTFLMQLRYVNDGRPVRSFLQRP